MRTPVSYFYCTLVLLLLLAVIDETWKGWEATLVLDGILLSLCLLNILLLKQCTLRLPHLVYKLLCMLLLSSSLLLCEGNDCIGTFSFRMELLLPFNFAIDYYGPIAPVTGWLLIICLWASLLTQLYIVLKLVWMYYRWEYSITVRK